jgi:tetratricopeptide (TPR) repeat protein
MSGSRRHHTWLAAALIFAAGTADAKPKRRDALTSYERGVAAYKKGNYDAAVQALGKSFSIERDVDTLFAWAQAERKLDHCEKAIELLNQLLSYDLPAANREVVETRLTECRAEIAQRTPPSPPLEPAPAATPPPAPAPVVETPPPAPPPSGPASAGWYRDPLALGLVGGGVLAAGVGTALLLSARALDDDSYNAPNIEESRSLKDKAHARGNLGLITAGAGGALIVGGIARILFHDTGEKPAVTGWVKAGGAGLAITGAF